MSRHVSITKLLLALSLGVACSATRVGEEAPAVVRVYHCLGDAVPLCTAVEVSDTGLFEYARPGKRTIDGRLSRKETEELRRVARSVGLPSWEDIEDPIGSFVTVETVAGKRTLPLVYLPSDAVTLLRVVDSLGERVLGRAYRPIVDQSRVP